MQSDEISRISIKLISYQSDYQFPIKMLRLQKDSSLNSYCSQLQQAIREINY
jgi:hypothetical protein